MKVVLIASGSPASPEYLPPLGLAYIVSYLKKHSAADVHYLDHYRLSQRTIRSELARLVPDVVGINCVTPTRHIAIRLAAMVKEVCPKATVILGGIHATFLARQLLENYPQIDYVVQGEGEQAMLELVQCIEGRGDPASVAGLAFRRDGQVVETPRRAWIQDLDALPFPEYAEHYSTNERRGRKCGMMITSRGCGGACNYCAVTRFWGRPRLRSATSVVDEMEYLVRQHRVGYIRMMDDTFTVDMDRAAAVCEEILRRGLKVDWRCTARGDCITRPLAQLLGRAGCVRLAIGVESGSPGILKTIHKMVDVKQAEDACRWAHEAGMELEACFMVGNIGETRETIEETKALARRIRPEDFCVSNAVYLFPGTPLFKYAERRGLVNDSVWLTDAPVVPFTAEHTLAQLSEWQMEIIRTCALSNGWFHYLHHSARTAMRMKPRALLKAGYSFLKANITPLWRRTPKEPAPPPGCG